MAVSIGLRLVYGDMSLGFVIVALILAPEVYLPLRMVGTQFHAAEDGNGGSRQGIRGDRGGFAAPEGGSTDGGRSRCRHRLRRTRRDLSWGVAPSQLSAVALPGAITVLTGPNGCGKSTAVHALLGLIEPSSGRVTVAGVDVRDLDEHAWWSQLAWLPSIRSSYPHVRENLDLTGVVDTGIPAPLLRRDSTRYWPSCLRVSRPLSASAAQVCRWGSDNDWR